MPRGNGYLRTIRSYGLSPREMAFDLGSMVAQLTTIIRAAVLRATRAASDAVNRCSTIGDMPSLPASGSSAHAALLADVERMIADGQNRIRFGRTIETVYAEATRQARDRFFVLTAVFGIIVYDLFLIPDALIVGDHIWLLSTLQLGLVTPVCIALAVLVARGRIDSNLPSIIGLSAMMTTTLAGLMMVRGEYAMLFACVLDLMIIGSNLVLAVAWTWAAAYTVVSNLAIAAALLCHPSIDIDAALFVIAMTMASSTYSIVGHYRIDMGLRAGFLFTLVERLRGDQLTARNSQLDTLAGLDGLTGIGNRRTFDRIMEEACGRSGVGLALIDIDHFKLVNDRHGHLVGDACLRRLAGVLVDRMPDGRCRPVRYGGEEFAVVIVGGDAGETFAIAEDIRLAIGEAALATDAAGQPLRVTVSIGCASLPAGTAASPTALVAAADRALYTAKRSGRNRTRMGQVDASPNPGPAGGAAVLDAA